MGRLETGRKDFRVTTLIRVSNALAVTLSELFAGVKGNKPAPVKKRKHASADQEDLEGVRIRRELAILEASVTKLRAIVSAKKER